MYKVLYPYFSSNDFDTQWNLFERVTYKFITGISKSHNVALAAFKLDYISYLSKDQLVKDYDKALKLDKIYITFSGDNQKRYFDFKKEYINIIYDEDTYETLNGVIDALDSNSPNEHPLINLLNHTPKFDFSNYIITDSSHYDNEILEQYSVPVYIVDYIDDQFKHILNTEYFSTNKLFQLVVSLGKTDLANREGVKIVLDDHTVRRNKNLIYPNKKNQTISLKFREVLIITSFTLLKNHPYFKIINLSNALNEKNKKNTFDYTDFTYAYTDFFSIIHDLIPSITQEMNVSSDKIPEFEKYSFYVLSTAFSYQNIYGHYSFMNSLSKLHQNFTSIFAETKFINHFIDYKSMEKSFTCLYNEWIEKIDETFKHVVFNNHPITTPRKESIDQIISKTIEEHTIIDKDKPIIKGIIPIENINHITNRLEIFESLEKNINNQFMKKSKPPIIYNRINE